ncbi:MAG: endonuclease NucS, partial [Deltaproteobacteria bacterium]|nr:endonuclease NucS [Deltaproteobacteria bacterium]
MAIEKTIRDFLVTRLDLLEPDLVHVETEHKLPNVHGSKGSIDILARDALGHRVIIELKRSNDSARSAIHELCKYVALFKTEHGLPSHRLRCFVVSTHWHELLIPFGEFVRASDFQVEGFELRVSPNGTPISAKKIVVPAAPEPVEFFLHHDVLLYETVERRDSVAMGVVDQLIKSGATSAFVCKLNSSASPNQLPYRYALYSVVGGIEPTVRAQIESELKAEYETDDLESINPTMVQEDFSRRLLEQSTWAHDTYEIGYPDKLSTILRTGWSCVEIIRRGRMISAAAVSDEELLASLQGLTGDNTIMYLRVATPRITQSWTDFLNASEKCLRGNPAWERAFKLFGRLLELHQPDSLVSAKVYNPLQIPVSLHK